MGAKSRRKGAQAEREFATLLFEYLGLKAKRNLEQYQTSDGRDLVGAGPFCLQLKRYARCVLEGWMQEAESAARPGEIPAVALRVDGGGWIVAFRFEKGGAQLMANELDGMGGSPTEDLCATTTTVGDSSRSC